MRDDAVTVRDLTVSYGDEPVVKDVDLDIPRGRLVGVVGPNGAGKTTLVKAMLGLLPVDRGTVAFFGRPAAAMRRWVAYLPQRNVIDWDFPIDVLDTVLLGTYPHLKLFRRPGRREREWGRACLAQVDMADYAGRQIGRLSGGQQQRVFIARALAQRADLLFLDEPFVGVDARSEELIVDLLRRLRDGGKTALIVHHDLSKVQDYYDDVLLINKKLVAYGPTADVFTRDYVVAAFDGRPPFLELGADA